MMFLFKKKFSFFYNEIYVEMVRRICNTGGNCVKGEMQECISLRPHEVNLRLNLWVKGERWRTYI